MSIPIISCYSSYKGADTSNTALLLVMIHFLVSPPHSWFCSGRHSKASCNGTHGWGCALLDKLDYLCNLNGLWVLSHAKVAAQSLRKSKIAEKSFRVYKERVMVCGYHMQNHSTFVILSSTPVVTFIWTTAGEMDSQWFMIPKWTDWPCRSLIMWRCFVFVHYSIVNK